MTSTPTPRPTPPPIQKPPGLPFAEINAAALARLPHLLREWLPAGKMVGREYRCGSIAGERGQSFSVNVDNGRWAEFGDGTPAKGGDPVSLFAAIFTGGDQGDAARQLGAQLGVPVPGSTPGYSNGHAGNVVAMPLPTAPAAKGEAWQPTTPPDSVGPPPEHMFTGCSMRHEYRNEVGDLTHYVRRFEATASKPKMFLPITYGSLKGVTGWHEKGPAKPYPLFGLEQLAAQPDTPVMLHEGERKSLVARALFPEYVHVAWSGGAGQAGNADLRPLADRHVTVFGDAGEAGQAAVAKLLAMLPPGTRTVRADDLRDGYDAADVAEEIAPGSAKLALAGMELAPGDLDYAAKWLAERLRTPATEAKGRGRYDLLTPMQISAEPGRLYVLKGLFSRGDHAILMGHPGSGKSVIVPHIGYAVAQGRTVLGRRVKGGPVLYLAGEDGHGMKNRVRALLQRYGDAPNFYLMPVALDLMTKDGPDRQALLDLVEKLQPVLIINDTVAASFPGIRENESDDMGRVVRLGRDLAAVCDSLVLSVHHIAKDGGTTPRGHGNLGADVDITMLVEGQRTETRTITLGKNRNGPSDITLRFDVTVAEIGIDEDGDPITAPIANEVDAAAVRATGREDKLPDRTAVLLRVIRSIDPRQIQDIRPEPDMPICHAVKRDTLRSVMISQGWFSEGELFGDATDKKLTKDAHTRENNALTTLKRKGFLGFNRDWVWLQ